MRPESENYKPWTKDEDELITRLVYQATPLQEISKELNRSYNSCSSRSNRLGLYNKYSGAKKYFVNDFFWDEPNNLNCYYAGILAADGCLTLYEKRFKYTGNLKWTLKESDENLLINFKKDTNFTGQIKTIKVKNCEHYKSIQISCDQWNKNLIEKFNITPKKIYRTLPPNNLTEQQTFCWLIGYIDGDGSVHLDKKNNSLTISVTSCSKQLIDFIYEFLKERFPQRVDILREVSSPIKVTNTNCWRITINGIRALCLYDYLRHYNLPKLKRKWNQTEINNLLSVKKEKFPNFFSYDFLPVAVS